MDLARAAHRRRRDSDRRRRPGPARRRIRRHRARRHGGVSRRLREPGEPLLGGRRARARHQPARDSHDRDADPREHERGATAHDDATACCNSSSYRHSAGLNRPVAGRADRRAPAQAALDCERAGDAPSGRGAGSAGAAPRAVKPRALKPRAVKPGAVKPGVPAPAGSNNVAVSPQLAAGEAGALAAALASSAASVQALGFYRIPLFLLPIYKAAAVQYGVPWQILAAINEIETNYGSDQSVSTAGAVGWMQFMPETWLQYGVDALDAGYADPYNPVDAIFAAARYLRAAGAASDLHAAILAYNHSEEYVSSVLLRAKLISSYPKSVIATLTGLTDGRLPVTGKHITWAAKLSSVSSRAPRRTGTPGSTLALAPAAAAAVAAKVSAAGQALQLAEVRSAPNAHVVAVQDGRITAIGRSRRLGRYLVLRDVYGDVFTYAALGSIAQTYTLAKPSPARVKSPVVEAASTRDPAPSRAASAGNQPVTLKVKAPTHKRRAMSAGSAANSSEGTAEATSPVVGKVRLFARPGNPDAVAGAVLRRARGVGVGDRLALRRGVVVAAGTVLGRVAVVAGVGLVVCVSRCARRGMRGRSIRVRCWRVGRSLRWRCIRRARRRRMRCWGRRRAMCC